MSKEMTVRVAQASDSEQFAQWIADSTHIPSEDVQDSLKESNPTSITLVIEENGKTILFAPTYAIALLGFIGFNPETDLRERVRALDAIKRAAQAFWGMYGVTEIATLTMEHYPIAQWALKHGFELDPRQIVKLKMKRGEGKAN